MSQDEFIKRNLIVELKKMRFSDAAAEKAAEDGLQFWLQSSHFKKSAWNDTLAFAKRRAKQI